MKLKNFAAIAAFTVAFAGCFAFAAEPTKDQKTDPMMKAMMDYATPGPAQKAMQGMVGTWTASVKSYMDPTKPPVESTGTSTYSSLMDGRYLQENVESTFMGQPFHGHGIYGYDNALKKYVSTWVDSMGTGIMYSTGTSTDGGKTITYTGKATDPMTGKEQSYRSTMHMVTNDQYHFEMFGPGPDGKEAKMMEITYNRKK
jgi:hypothetical protein